MRKIVFLYISEKHLAIVGELIEFMTYALFFSTRFFINNVFLFFLIPRYD